MKILGYLRLPLQTLMPLVMMSSIACAGTTQAVISNLEVVQSVPIETTLAVPGIRLTQDVWLELISSAQKSIDLEEFYIDEEAGQSLEPIVNAVLAAAARGVQVRLIVDLKFYKTYPDVPNQFSNIQNIQVKTIDFSSLGGIQHSKFIVVDQSHSFVGSANFDWLALTHIHEVGLNINDEQTGSGLETIYDQDWSVGSPIGTPQFSINFHALQAPQNGTQSGTVDTEVSGMQLVASPISDLPKGIPQSLNAIVQLLGTAKNSIKIQVYQYSTKSVSTTDKTTRWTALDTAIRAAAARGVQVQMIVDAVALKTASLELKALAGQKNILVRSVVIPQWSGGPIAYARLIHSKYFTVDGVSAWVGTENWSESYFTGCRNVGVILHSQNTATQLGQIFDRVWNSSYITAM